MKTEIPIGGIIAWTKSITGIPQTLPHGWVECNGQTIADLRSIFNSQAVPDLNGALDGLRKFLRGAPLSGGTGGSDSATASSSSSQGPTDTVEVGFSNTVVVPGLCHYHDITISTVPNYYEIVYIIRIK